jgi:glutamyl-tRNA synthetase
MLRHFALDRVNNSPASFDPDKLIAFQSRAMSRVPIKQKVAKCVPFLQGAGLVADPPPCDTGPYVTQIVEAAGDRVKVFGDILDFDDFFVADIQLCYDEKAFEKRIAKPANAISLLTRFRDVPSAAEPFTADVLEKLTHAFVESQGIKIGDVVHSVRVAVTGKPVGFGLFDTLAILGRDRCLARIDRALAKANAAT